MTSHSSWCSFRPHSVLSASTGLQVAQFLCDELLRVLPVHVCVAPFLLPDAPFLELFLLPGAPFLELFLLSGSPFLELFLLPGAPFLELFLLPDTPFLLPVSLLRGLAYAPLFWLLVGSQ